MSDLSSHTVTSGTWVLFEDGSCAAVSTTLYRAAAEKSIPCDAYMVHNREGVFSDAVRRAAEAIYNTAQDRFPVKGPVVFSCEVMGLGSGQAVTGPSGGLAFAVDMARKIFKRDPGPVAATGVVRSGHHGGPVSPVKAIVKKLEAAGRVLPEKSWILYPKENDLEIPGILRKFLTETRGFKLVAVSSVSHALSELFPEEKRASAESDGEPVPLPQAVEPEGDPKPKLPPAWQKKLLTTVIMILFAGILATAGMWVSGWGPFRRKPQPMPVDTPSSRSSGIDLTGTSFLAKDLAGRLSKLLSENIEQGNIDELKTVKLSGVIAIERIVEITEGDSEALTSELRVSVDGLKIIKTDGVQPVPKLTISVKGPGPAGALAPTAAMRLYETIQTTLKAQKKQAVLTPKKKKTPGGKGFE